MLRLNRAKFGPPPPTATEVTADSFTVTREEAEKIPAYMELVNRVNQSRQPMPEGFDADEERRRLQQGGCCGGTSV